MDRHTLTLRPRAPYDFDLTMEFLASFQGGTRVDVFEGGEYQRLFERHGKLLLAGVRSLGTVERPELEVTVQGHDLTDEDAAAITGAVEWMLSADVPLKEFYALAARDPIVGAVVNQLYGLHPSRTATVFEAFVHAISAQQIASAVARIIRTMLLENYSPTLSLNGRIYYAFPGPSAVLSRGVEGLREIKLSTRKAEYILDTAAAIENGTLDMEGLRHRPDQEVAEMLIGLRGVGQWTVQWLLLRALGRLNAFPSGDLALQRVVSRFYFEGQRLSEPEVEEFSQRWSPWRSLFTTYLFAALRRGLVQA